MKRPPKQQQSIMKKSGPSKKNWPRLRPANDAKKVEKLQKKIAGTRQTSEEKMKKMTPNAPRFRPKWQRKSKKTAAMLKKWRAAGPVI